MKMVPVFVFLLACSTASVAWGDEIDYNRDVRPILSDKCFHCHGPDEHNRKANLRLDIFEGSRQAVKGERPEATKLYGRITNSNVKKRMPPTDANVSKFLSAQEIEILKKWVGKGAPYSKHWSFEPPVQVKPPNTLDPAWQQPIDRFIAAKLAKAGLKPAPRADKAMLLRRVSFDLTGLPPTPVEVEAFVTDQGPDAYEKVVDRLLKSPRFGERMAVFWMDLARFGDSSVYHADGPRDMWMWREGVIRSFNENQRFDQFTIEQLAGDRLPDATLQQKIASGFNRNHATTDEGGVISEEFRVDYVVDRVKTVSNTWMALSLECCQCHDHKYDPISQREYYQFYAFFNNTKDGGMQTRRGNAAPVVTVPDSDLVMMSKIVKEARLASEKKRLQLRTEKKDGDEFREWLAEQKSTAAPLPRTPDFFAPLDEKNKTTFASSSDGQIAVATAPIIGAKRPNGNGVRFDGKTALSFAEAPEFDPRKPFTMTVWVQVPAKGGGPIVSSIDAIDGWQIGIEGLSPTLWIKQAGPKQSLKLVSKAKLALGSWQHLVFTGDGSKTAAGACIYIDGERVEAQTIEDSLTAVAGPFSKRRPLQVGEGLAGAKFVGALDDLCVFRDKCEEAEIKLCAQDPFARLHASANLEGRGAMILDHYLRTADEDYEKALLDLSHQIGEERNQKLALTSVMVMEDLPEAKTRPTFVLNRGQYDQPLKNQPIKPGVPAVLPALSSDAPGNRLGLARWLVGPNQPLTARVAVNRFWQIAFGEGLVRTTEDFGMQGEMPSHAELLDWLAVDFVKSGWDVKRAIKQIVMSSTYCQDSRLTAAVREADPENRLLARGPRIRLQGEFIRDNALFVSGLLVEKIGGRSVKPYQPAGLWEAVTLATERYVPDHGDKLYRRSLYTYWKRSAPHPAMLTFDVPTREKCIGRRSRTNTPLQTLVTLNDPQFVEAARAFAQRIVTNGGTSSRERIQFAYAHALARPATEREVKLLESLLDSQRARFQADPKKAEALLKIGESPRDASIPAIDHAVWTVVASTLMNLDEFLMKN